MDWNAWRPHYEAILREFGYDRAADEAARDQLDALLEGHAPVDLDALRLRVEGRTVVVVGPLADGARLDALSPEEPVLVTDGAAGMALPRVDAAAIVTDLDGDVARQQAANARGVPVFVHAHGDNRDALGRHVPGFRGPLQGTTQAPPRGRVRNFGGFTDGDRAACLAAHLGAVRIRLVGFDFRHPVPKAGRTQEEKTRKLAAARRILATLPIPVDQDVSASTQS